MAKIKKVYKMREELPEGVMFSDLSKKWLVRVRNKRTGKLNSIGQLDKEEDAWKLYEQNK